MPSGDFLQHRCRGCASACVCMCMYVYVCGGERDREKLCMHKSHMSSTHRLQASSGRDIFCASRCLLAGRTPEGTGEEGRRVRGMAFPTSLRLETHSGLTLPRCKLPELAGHRGGEEVWGVGNGGWHLALREEPQTIGARSVGEGLSPLLPERRTYPHKEANHEVHIPQLWPSLASTLSDS